MKVYSFFSHRADFIVNLIIVILGIVITSLLSLSYLLDNDKDYETFYNFQNEEISLLKKIQQILSSQKACTLSLKGYKQGDTLSQLLDDHGLTYLTTQDHIGDRRLIISKILLKEGAWKNGNTRGLVLYIQIDRQDSVYPFAPVKKEFDINVWTNKNGEIERCLSVNDLKMQTARSEMCHGLEGRYVALTGECLIKDNKNNFLYRCPTILRDTECLPSRSSHTLVASSNCRGQIQNEPSCSVRETFLTKKSYSGCRFHELSSMVTNREIPCKKIIKDD